MPSDPGWLLLLVGAVVLIVPLAVWLWMDDR